MLSEETIWTIGHSTHSRSEFYALLHAHDIALIADVRRFPASRRLPQFNRETMQGDAGGHAIAYEWLEDLGGRRNPRKDSHNTAWRNASFRGYADYMESERFAHAASTLMGHARMRRTVVMCAEHAWQQCHRGLIADYLKARGVKVWHILSNGRTELHPFTAAARIVDGALSYRAEDGADQSGFAF
jgi:uncharacterized protein (DUF488 family)